MLLSSHILSEVERLADRVTIIRDGRAVESGSLEELRHLRRNKVRAEVSGPVPDLAGIPGVHDVTVDGHTRDLHGRPRGMAACSRRSPRPASGTLTSTPPTPGGALPRRLPPDPAGTAR